MDIEYLLWLQNWREATGNFLTPFMSEWSNFSVGLLVLVPVFIYWCVNRRAGLFLMMSYAVSQIINAILKLTFCAYRPWIRDKRIVPAENAIKKAGGYSFPSGHTMEATPIFGGLAVLCKKNKHSWLITLLLAVAIFMTAFSRNYLGVHTPQDVVVGTLFALIAIWIAAKIFAYIEKNPEKENLILLSGVIFAALTLVYAEFKSYPVDYVDGKILVDPVPMTRHAYKAAGMFLGFATGRFLEKKFVRFSPTGFEFKKFAVAFIGLLIYFFIVTKLDHALRDTALKVHKGYFVSGFINAFFQIFLWPCVIKKFAN